MNQSLGGLSPKRHLLRSVLKMTRNHSRKGRRNSIPAEREGHSLGTDVTPQSRDVSPGCSLWLKEGTCTGRGRGEQGRAQQSQGAMRSATEGSAVQGVRQSPAGENYGATSGTLTYHDPASLPCSQHTR